VDNSQAVTLLHNLRLSHQNDCGIARFLCDSTAFSFNVVRCLTGRVISGNQRDVGSLGAADGALKACYD